MKNQKIINAKKINCVVGAIMRARDIPEAKKPMEYDYLIDGNPVSQDEAIDASGMSISVFRSRMYTKGSITVGETTITRVKSDRMLGNKVRNYRKKTKPKDKPCG